MVEQIKKAIENQLPGAKAFVRDPHHDGQHFEADVVSVQFAEMSLLKRHQVVMKALKTEFDSAAVHALQLKTWTPEEWDTRK